MEDDDSHQPQAPRSSRSKVKVARSRDQPAPSALPVLLESGGGIVYTVSAEPGGHTHFLFYVVDEQLCVFMCLQNTSLKPGIRIQADWKFHLKK